MESKTESASGPFCGFRERDFLDGVLGGGEEMDVDFLPGGDRMGEEYGKWGTGSPGTG